MSGSPIRRTRSRWARFGSTRIASTYYQVKVGGDAAALKGIMKAILDAAETDGDVLDHEFIAAHTNGFDAFAADLRATALGGHRAGQWP